MARRRSKKDDSLISLAISSHWGISATLAVVTLIGFLWFFPAVFSSSKTLKPLGPTLVPIGYIIAGIFAVIAIVNFLRTKRDSSTSPVNAMHGVPGVDIQSQQKSKKHPATADVMDLSFESEVEQPQDMGRPTAWSMKVLQSIEWKRFEELVAAFYQLKGVEAKTQRCGADGGIDVHLFKKGFDGPLAVVQCKAWNTYRVGVKPVRELLGVMASAKVRRGMFITTGNYTDEAREFAKDNPLTLFDGNQFLSEILGFSAEDQQRLLEVALAGDYKTPTCPSCGIKMVKRTGNEGKFWGCGNFPRCRQTFGISAKNSSE
ncbi:MAG: restriction endonuclease [Rhodocyclales bacterium]|nr:restriction endonuclease [Rhodocyclales bacterium]